MDKNLELKKLIFKLFEDNNLLTKKVTTKFDGTFYELTELEYYIELEDFQYILNDYTGKLEILDMIESEIVADIELSVSEYKKFISLCNKKLQKSNDGKLDNVIEKLKKLI